MHNLCIEVVYIWFQLMKNGSMENKIRIEVSAEPYHVLVDGKRYSIIDAASIFHVRMLNTLQAMDDGIISEAIEVIVKEVAP